MRYAAIGIDIGKSVFHVVALDVEGQVALRRKVTRRKRFDLLLGIEPTLVGMEASCGAHHLARSAHARGRDLAAWLGLVPQQRSTGGRTMLGGISKRGNSYLRKLLIVGAQSVRLNLDRSRHPRLGAWLTALERRAHGNVAVVALANKIARIAWSVLRRGETYAPRPLHTEVVA